MHQNGHLIRKRIVFGCPSCHSLKEGRQQNGQVKARQNNWPPPSPLATRLVFVECFANPVFGHLYLSMPSLVWFHPSPCPTASPGRGLDLNLNSTVSPRV